jgi:Predicted nucleic acid-binding protein, contains PIN domain
MSKKVFVDTDIVLDLLTKREPFYSAAAKVFSLAADKEIDLYISPVLISNLFYILRKVLGREEAINAIRKLRVLVRVVTIDEEIVDLVLSSNFKDIEDGFQYYGALQDEIGILLTRNTKDFVGKEIVIMNCEEFIEFNRIGMKNE